MSCICEGPPWHVDGCVAQLSGGKEKRGVKRGDPVQGARVQGADAVGVTGLRVLMAGDANAREGLPQGLLGPCIAKIVKVDLGSRPVAGQISLVDDNAVYLGKQEGANCKGDQQQEAKSSDTHPTEPFLAHCRRLNDTIIYGYPG